MVDVVESLKTAFLSTIGAQEALTFPLSVALGGTGADNFVDGAITHMIRDDATQIMVDGEWTVPEPTMQDQLEVQAAAIAELAEIVAGGE